MERPTTIVQASYSLCAQAATGSERYTPKLSRSVAAWARRRRPSFREQKASAATVAIAVSTGSSVPHRLLAYPAGMLYVEINGAAPSIADLHRVAVVNYGHFTSMQVRENRVRGLDLHLRRLDDASKELFMATPGADRIRSLLRRALDHVPGDVSARISVFARSGDISVPTPDVDLAVMVSLSDPVPETRQTPWNVCSIPYLRESAHLKHAATMGLIRARRAARSQGFDDAVFTGPDGLILEGSIWNLGLWDGETVTWPQAPKLPGVTEQLLTMGLHRIGVRTRTRPVVAQDLAHYQAAFASYSWCPAQPLASLDDVSFANPAAAFTMLGKAWDSVPWETV